MCKSYSTFGLFNMYCSSFFFFFSQSSICALFSTVFLHCSYSVFHCISIVPFWLATLYFFFFKFWTLATVASGTVATIATFFFFFLFSLLFVLFFSFYIYYCTFSVFALYIYSAILLSQLCLFFFWTVATVPSGTVATVATFFFSLPFVLFFFFYIYCYTDTTNFIIFSQLLRCQFFISQNKIIKYETVTNHKWK